MSGGVRLTLRAPLTEPVEIDGFAPDVFATLDEAGIARLPAWVGRHEAALGDFFTVGGGHADDVAVAGDLRPLVGIARGMTGGTLTIEGDVGDDVAQSMRGGSLIVHGNAGDRLAAASPGTATGMTGGEVVVTGMAGDETAARARRGLVVVRGSVGHDAARSMIAGSLVVFGAVGADPGRGSKRGSIVALGSIGVPPTYRYACTYRPPHVRLTLLHLRHRYGLAIEDDLVAGAYRRYCGDIGDPGKGEILQWVTP
jgi:formylmethanofuran dehydrogenase subunit C